MFRRYALCLLPVVIAFVLLAAGMAGWNPESAIFGQLVVGLLVIGGIACSTTVSRKVYSRLESGPGVKWLLTILTFIGVAIAYGGVVFAGCCGILIVGSRLA